MATKVAPKPTPVTKSQARRVETQKATTTKGTTTAKATTTKGSTSGRGR